MSYDVEKMKTKLEEAITELGFDTEKIAGITFHLTDWVDEMERWEQFCSDPDSLTAQELRSLLMEFLYIVPSHLAAASKLLTGLPVADIFNIGATSELTS